MLGVNIEVLKSIRLVELVVSDGSFKRLDLMLVFELTLLLAEWLITLLLRDPFVFELVELVELVCLLFDPMEDDDVVEGDLEAACATATVLLVIVVIDVVGLMGELELIDKS